MRGFASRWGVEEEDDNTKIEKYINRLIARIGETPSASYSELKVFAFIAGVPASMYSDSNTFNGSSWFKARVYLTNFDSLHEIAKKLEDLLNSPILSEDTKKSVVDLTNSSHIGIRVAIEGDSYLTYPEGEPKLDKEVVEKALLSLGKNSGEEYSQALKAYSLGDWVKSSEKTRRALEEYLREYFLNSQGLSKNILQLGSVLKNNSDIASHFRIALTSQLSNLDRQYNEASKHASKTEGSVETEYLIYQTGVFINTLEQLKHRLKN